MTKSMTTLALTAAIILGGCNQSGTATGQPDSVVINGVTYTKAGGGAAPATPLGTGAAPTMPGAPLAAPPQTAPAGGTIPAVGRWTAVRQATGGDEPCGELGDVEFTPTGITAFGPNGQSESHPVTFANVTPTSFTIYDGSRILANVRMIDQNSLTLSKGGGTTRKICMLTRR